MRILRIKREKNSVQIYDIANDRRLVSFQAGALDDITTWLDQYEGTIDYLLIPLSRPYKDAAYKLSRWTHPVISKEEVLGFLGKIVGEDYLAFGQEAAAAEDEVSEDLEDLFGFIHAFYRATSRDTAEVIYNRWQELIPQNNAVYYKILSLMERYREEILNYFEIKQYVLND